jgi:hypothetical protein
MIKVLVCQLVAYNAHGFVPLGKLIIVSLADEMIFWKMI